MISLKKRNSGFTIVELLIVIVVIGILAAIVITTYAGIQGKARNAKRQTDINSLQTNLEAYYTQNQHYPSNTDMNTATFLSTNMPSLQLSALQDPSGTYSGTAPSTTTPWLATAPAAKIYSYAPSNSGASCEASDVTCNEYTITATLEPSSAGTYSKQNLD